MRKSCVPVQAKDGLWYCQACGRGPEPHYFHAYCKEPSGASATIAAGEPPAASPQFPGKFAQAWNLATSLVAFVADGCKTVSKDEYRERLDICDACEFRSDNRCERCGCFLALKAQGRAFKCPENKWPEVTDAN